MFRPAGTDLIRGWPGRIEGDRVIQLAAQTLQSYFTGGGLAREHAEYGLDEVELLPPVLKPPSVRDFYAFEQHVKTARARRGLEVPEEWYRVPVFYFSNPNAIYGPEAEIPYPEGTQELDYELEVAVVIGADGGIGGFTVMNDWSARDLQREEMKVGLGPAKGKDFATSLGPLVSRRTSSTGPPRRWSPESTVKSVRAASWPTCTIRGKPSLPRPHGTQSYVPARSSDRARSAPAASSSTATGGGSSRATSSSSRSRGSACSGTASSRGRRRALVAEAEEREHGLDVVLALDWLRDPAAVTDDVMRQRPAVRDQLFGNPLREGEVGKPVTVYVAELPLAEHERDTSETVWTRSDAVPTFDLGSDALGDVH
jgi:hypothetical protein